MTWKGIVEQKWKPSEFNDYVKTLRWDSWRPTFIVAHNSGNPSLYPLKGHGSWHGSTSPEQRIRNLVGFYRDTQRWSAGPHLFVSDEYIYGFTPLTTAGIHATSWNRYSIGVEIVGDFDFEPFDGAVRELSVACFAILHANLGLDPDTIRFHRDEPAAKRIGKSCPGKNVNKADFIKRVHDYINAHNNGDHEPHGADVSAAAPAIPPTATKPTPVSDAVRQYRIIRKGSPDAAVKAVQAALNLTQDGDYGPKTTAAVKAFQEKHDLTADGIVGKATAETLDRN